MLVEAYGCSNRQVRVYCKQPSVYAALLRRRVRMWQQIAKRPTHHVALVAALAGNIPDTQKQLDHGNPSSSCNPWLAQMWQDIQIVCHHSPSVSREIIQKRWIRYLNVTFSSTFQSEDFPFSIHQMMPLSNMNLPFFTNVIAVKFVEEGLDLLSILFIGIMDNTPFSNSFVRTGALHVYEPFQP